MSRDFNPAPEDGINLFPITGDPDGGVDLSAHLADPDPHTGYQKETEKGVANGYASLDGDGKVPSGQLPSVGGGKLINFWIASTTTAVSGTTLIPLDDTVPQITEGMELMRVSVTPTNPSSTLRVTVRFWHTCTGAHYASCALFVGAGPDASASSFLSQNASSIPALATVVFIIPSFSGTQDISFRAGTDRISVTFRMLSTGAGSYFSTTDPAIMIVEEIAL